MTSSRHSWDYPECPECGTDVFVGLDTVRPYAHCYWCDRRFEAPEYFA